MSDSLDPMRAALAGLQGPVRARPLLELASKLQERYWRIGPGQPAGLDPLNEAIVVAGEAYGYFDTADGWRGRVASMLGWLHGVRFLAHAGPESDRDAGVALLAEAVVVPGLPPVLLDMSRLVLGQLYFARAARVMQSPQLPGMLLGGGLPVAATADADRAAELFRSMLSEQNLGAETREAATAMLTMAEAFRTVLASLGGGAAGFDMTAMMQAMSVIQDLQRSQNSRSARGGGFPAMPSLFDGDAISRMDPLDRPVAVIDAPALPRQPPMPQADPIVSAADETRRELHTLVAPGGDFLGALAALLGPDGAGVETDDVDDMVALAVAVTSHPGADGTDQLALAVALYLRGRHDAEPGGDLDLSRAAVDRASGASDPAAVLVLNRLAALLDRGRPAAEQALFVVGPGRDHGDAELLRRVFYPGAGLLDPATPDAVLAGLSTPVLHLACGVTPAGALRLADGTELPPERIRGARTTGGLAVLPPTGVGLPALGDALLGAGFSGVVTWKRVVPSRIAALMSFVLHAALTEDRLEPADAVRQVREWMRDPHRPRPKHLPEGYAATLHRPDLVGEQYWGSLVFRAREE